MTHPKILARGLLLVIALLALMAAPMAFAPADAAQPGRSTSAASAATGVTPGYAGAHMARLQPAPPQQSVTDLVNKRVSISGPVGPGDEIRRDLQPHWQPNFAFSGYALDE